MVVASSSTMIWRREENSPTPAGLPHEKERDQWIRWSFVQPALHPARKSGDNSFAVSSKGMYEYSAGMQSSRFKSTSVRWAVIAPLVVLTLTAAVAGCNSKKAAPGTASADTWATVDGR